MPKVTPMAYFTTAFAKTCDADIVVVAPLLKLLFNILHERADVPLGIFSMLEIGSIDAYEDVAFVEKRKADTRPVLDEIEKAAVFPFDRSNPIVD